MIVRVQNAELSSVQRFVLRLVGDWGAGSERIGGIALLGCPLPRPRRRSTTVIDLLVWTPHGCTLVVLADFRSVQHGVLETPPDGRWQIGERAADLRTGSGTANPLVRARRQRAELAAIFRRHGVPEQIDVLVVLIPKTGSRITWARPLQEAGEETIMVRIGQSTDFTEYFRRPPGRFVRWRAGDLARAFPALGIPLSTPDPEESAAEGFEVTAADVVPRPPATTDSAADRLPKTGFPLFGGSRRRAAQPDNVGEVPGRDLAGRIGHGPAGWTEHVGAVPGTGPAGPQDEPAVDYTASRTYPADRESVPDGVAAPLDALENSGTPGLGQLPGPAVRPPRFRAAEAVSQAADIAETAGRQSEVSVAEASAVGRPGTGPRPPAAETAGGPGATGSSADPVEQPETRTTGHGTLGSARVAVGVRRRLTDIRKASARRGSRGRVVRSAGGPSRLDREQPVAGLRIAGHRAAGAGRSGKKAGGGRGARYAAAVGAAGAVLAVIAGTVFAASGFARFEVAEYESVCRGGGGTTVAAPYSAGTSPVHLAGELAEVTVFGPSAVWHPVDARSVQLVACVSEGRLGNLVRTCQYPPASGHPVGRTLNLFAMAYRLSVYEARTGNRLAAIDLTGEQFAADPAVTETDGCRAATGAPEEGLPGRRHSRLSHRQVQHALAPFVTPAAAHIQAAR